MRILLPPEVKARLEREVDRRIAVNRAGLATGTRGRRLTRVEARAQILAEGLLLLIQSRLDT